MATAPANATATPPSVRIAAALVVAGALLVSGTGAPGRAVAADTPLLQQRGQHPLNAVFGLPPVASRTLRASEWQVALEHASVFAGGVAGTERLTLDGESSELALRHRRRLARCWQGEAHVTLVAHSGGFADHAIEGWHSLFGLPGADREQVPANTLRYAWIGADGERRVLSHDVAGPGDVTLALQRVAGCASSAGEGDDDGRAVLRAGVKLPSGDASRLLGSGATDVFADVQSPIVRFGSRARVAAALGLLAPGRSPLFDAQRPLVGYGTVGLEYRVHPRWRLLAQIDGHTPFRDSALTELGDPAMSLSVGLRRTSARGHRLELTIAEDALVDTVPDIVARLAWTWRPGRPGPAPPR